MADVLVIVVTFNAMEWLEKCLGSIVGSDVPADAIIIDNASSDGTAQAVRERFPQFRLIETGKNLGFGAANNIGLRMAIDEGYRFAYLLNQDAWLEKDTLSGLIAAARPQYGILSPLQKDAEGKLDRNFDRKCGISINEYSKTEASAAGSTGDIVPVQFVMAAHWLLTRKAIETVGGFSPAFRQYGEDDNYIDRLHFHGMKCGVVPKAAAVHDRAGRKTSKTTRMKLKCTATVVKVSNPANNFLTSSILEVIELVGMSVKNLSAEPLRFIPTLIGRLGELKRLQLRSKEKGAFLRLTDDRQAKGNAAGETDNPHNSKTLC